MPRFHLSTLLLLCIFAGAVIGLALNNKVWQLEYALPLGNDSKGRQIAPLSIAVDGSGKHIAVAGEYSLSLFDSQTKTLRWNKLDAAQRSIGRVQFLDEGRIVQVSLADRDFEFNVNVSDGSSIPIDWNAVGLKKWKSEPIGGSLDMDLDAPNHSEWLEISIGQKTSSVQVCSANCPTLFSFDAIDLPSCGAYFSDGRRVAIGCDAQDDSDARIEVWRRVRNYGWMGFIELPLTWAALATFAALVVIFIRWLYKPVVIRSASNA